MHAVRKPCRSSNTQADLTDVPKPEGQQPCTLKANNRACNPKSMEPKASTTISEGPLPHHKLLANIMLACSEYTLPCPPHRPGSTRPPKEHGLAHATRAYATPSPHQTRALYICALPTTIARLGPPTLARLGPANWIGRMQAHQPCTHAALTCALPTTTAKLGPESIRMSFPLSPHATVADKGNPCSCGIGSAGSSMKFD